MGTAQKDIPEVQGEGPIMRFNQIVHSAPASIISGARRDAGADSLISANRRLAVSVMA